MIEAARHSVQVPDSLLDCGCNNRHIASDGTDTKRPRPRVTVRPVEGPAPVAMPEEFAPRRLLRRALEVTAILLVVLLIGLLAPGLGEVRRRLAEAQPGWILLAVGLEALSCLSYVLMFRP